MGCSPLGDGVDRDHPQQVLDREDDNRGHLHLCPNRVTLFSKSVVGSNHPPSPFLHHTNGLLHNKTYISERGLRIGMTDDPGAVGGGAGHAGGVGARDGLVPE